MRLAWCKSQFVFGGKKIEEGAESWWPEGAVLVGAVLGGSVEVLRGILVGCPQDDSLRMTVEASLRR
jgi:hypothetical protein